jgi:oligopeptide/dipeptide ABC transporter ATP-binding protein
VSAEVLAVEGLVVDFPTPEGTVHAVRGVDLRVHEGETVGLVGESGSGKSVTMLAAMGLLPRHARVRGSIRYRGEELAGRRARDLRRLRGLHLAMVFQDPMTSFNPVQRVGHQIVEAVRAHLEVPRAAAWDRAVALLEAVGFADAGACARRYPHELSGGQRQRAMIAMAMVHDPDVLIADEPTTALDVTIQAQVLETLHRVREELGTAIVLITHDLGVVARMADRVVVMYAGQVVEQGGADEVFGAPRHPYTLGLMRSVPRLDAVGPLLPIRGVPPSMVSPPAGCAFHPRCDVARANCATDAAKLRDIGAGAHRSACLYAEELHEVAP